MDKAKLIEDINLQIENLERLNKEINELLARLKKAPDFIQIRACTSILQDFYSGIEKIFERITLMVDNNLPKGENWHIEWSLPCRMCLMILRKILGNFWIIWNLINNLGNKNGYRV